MRYQDRIGDPTRCSTRRGGSECSKAPTSPPRDRLLMRGSRDTFADVSQRRRPRASLDSPPWPVTHSCKQAGLVSSMTRFSSSGRRTVRKFLDALDALPRTLQHGDASAPNLFARPIPGGEETIVIDWAWLGIGALGEDLAVLWNWFVRLARSTTTDQLMESYLTGLREAGWSGDERVVRLGWGLTIGVRYLAHPLMLAALEEGQRARFERHRGRPLEELLAELSDLIRSAVSIASEARELLPSI
jgi:Phosphotransferase enzyme family